VPTFWTHIISELGGVSWSGQILSAVLPKQPENRFQSVRQSRQQALRAYCPKLYGNVIQAYDVKLQLFIFAHIH
jgi:hypothetical protein